MILEITVGLNVTMQLNLHHLTFSKPFSENKSDVYYVTLTPCIFMLIVDWNFIT